MKLQSGEELLTLKDIASAISFDRSEGGVARTMRQVRHWTQCDLLRTVSEKSTGKGIPRLYEEEPTLQIAAILLELSRYGATVDILRPVAEELYESWDDEGAPHLSLAATDLNSYLQVAWTQDPVTGRFLDAEIHQFDETEQALEGAGFMPEPSSSILINMTTVSARIHAHTDAC